MRRVAERVHRAGGRGQPDGRVGGAWGPLFLLAPPFAA